MGTTPISTLANIVQNRLEETAGGAGAWWSRQYELYTGIVEAMNDLLLLVGRPTQVVNLPVTLTPNTVWQSMQKGIFAITDIQGANGPLWKINLYDLDYLQSSWGPDWEQDVDVTAKRWAPLGFNLFVVHPAVAEEQVVQITAIQYPTTDTWPYSGSETVPLEDQYFQLIEEYAAHYARIKETGLEFQEGMKLFDQYMLGAKRMTQFQDIRDPLLFSMGFGAAQNANPTTKR